MDAKSIWNIKYSSLLNKAATAIEYGDIVSFFKAMQREPIVPIRYLKAILIFPPLNFGLSVNNNDAGDFQNKEKSSISKKSLNSTKSKASTSKAEQMFSNLVASEWTIQISFDYFRKQLDDFDKQIMSLDQSNMIYYGEFFRYFSRNNTKTINPIKTHETIYRDIYLNYFLIPLQTILLTVYNSEIEFLNESVDLKLQTKHTVEQFTVMPDIEIRFENGLSIPVEIKKYNILKNIEQFLNQSHQSNSTKGASFLKQLLVNMTAARSPKGILTDCFTTILIQINFDKLEGKSHFGAIPFKYKIINYRSCDLTVRAYLLAFLLNTALLSPNEIESIFDSMISFSDQWRLSDDQLLARWMEKAGLYYHQFITERYDNKMFRDLFPKTDVVSKQFKFNPVRVGRQFNTQIILVDVSEYNQAFNETIDPAVARDGIIIKIFDPFCAKIHNSNIAKLSLDTQVDKCEKAFATELKIYNQIIEYNQKCPAESINAPNIYKSGFLKINNPNNSLKFCGLFLAMEYLGTEKPATKMDFEDGANQLSRIHKINIVHQDIKLDNVFQYKNRFVFIDFGFSSNNPGNKWHSESDDINDFNALKEAVLGQF